MKTLILTLAFAFIASAQTTPVDTSRFIQAKVAIAKEVQKQEEARLAVCQAQPRAKQPLCAKWADAANQAAFDVQKIAFDQIDKLMGGS